MSVLFEDAAPRYVRALMDVAIKQHATAAANIANIDTPGYRTRELEFRSAFESALARNAGGLARTELSHLEGGAPSSEAGLREVAGLPIRNDGNNVSIDREMLQLATAAGRYQAAITLLRREFAVLRYAISDGREG